MNRRMAPRPNNNEHLGSVKACDVPKTANNAITIMDVPIIICGHSSGIIGRFTDLAY